MNYQEFETVGKQWQGKVCMFGAGLIGQTWGYDLALAAGFQINFFCDDHIPAGTALRDGILTITPEDLYTYKDAVLVLLTVSEKFQEEIRTQLTQNGITHILEMGDSFAQDIYFSLEKENDPVLLEKYKAFMDDSEYLKRRFQYVTGYPLDLECPKTFLEKMNWIKVHCRKKIYTQMADKVYAKTFVSSIIGQGYVVPSYGVWNSFDEIDFQCLPDQFVLKTNHDSGGIVICKDKSQFDKAAARKKLMNAMKYNYYLAGREWPYKDIEPRILAEQYLGSGSVYSSPEERALGEGPWNAFGLLDYKVHCFQGKPMFIETIGSRDYKTHTAYETIYDFQWNEQNWGFGDYPRYKTALPKPSTLDEMYKCSKILSSGIGYIRIDWYEVQKELKFGELTMIPNSGYLLYNEDWTKESDLMLGSLIPTWI